MSFGIALVECTAFMHILRRNGLCNSPDNMCEHICESRPDKCPVWEDLLSQSESLNTDCGCECDPILVNCTAEYICPDCGLGHTEYLGEG